MMPAVNKHCIDHSLWRATLIYLMNIFYASQCIDIAKNLWKLKNERLLFVKNQISCIKQWAPVLYVKADCGDWGFLSACWINKKKKRCNNPEDSEHGTEYWLLFLLNLIKQSEPLSIQYEEETTRTGDTSNSTYERKKWFKKQNSHTSCN